MGVRDTSNCVCEIKINLVAKKKEANKNMKDLLIEKFFDDSKGGECITHKFICYILYKNIVNLCTIE